MTMVHLNVLMVVLGLCTIEADQLNSHEVIERSSHRLNPSTANGVVGVGSNTKKRKDSVTSRGRRLDNTNDNDCNHHYDSKGKPIQYELWEPEKINNVLEQWKEEYPDLIRVTTAQEAYGLPRAGNEEDCPFVEGDGCPNYIFTIQDYVVHPEGSDSSTHLPELFWSGCLHGNERVGPTAVMEAASLLLEAATCESKPRPHEANTNSDHKAWEVEQKEARQCRENLRKKGIDDIHRKWLARLITTRRIVAVPTTNALGYYRKEREEDGIDPNRDFPYDLNDPKLCMQTIAGRTVNEIFQEHMFQLSLTFHGGMEVVGYEWGAPTWLGGLSPDDTAQNQIAAAYSRFGGSWDKSPLYAYGTMNDLVYYVQGGMEDWAYAGSWDPERVIPCQPTTHGGYPEEKTIYNNSTLRVFNMLIETSDHKTPTRDELGTSLDLLDRRTAGNGHVSRNIRLALLAADLVEPYVSIVGVNELTFSDDVVPLKDRSNLTCRKNRGVIVPSNSTTVEFQWTVGGALNIDQTDLWYAKWDDILDGQLDCMHPPQSLDGFKKGHQLASINGTGYFSQYGPHPTPESPDGKMQAVGPLFRGIIDLPKGLKALDQIVVIAAARVDQAWMDVPPGVKPHFAPQSHIVNARNDPNWHHHSGDKHVRGRLNWFSVPVTIVIGDYESNVGVEAKTPVKSVEVNSRFGDSTGTARGGIRPNNNIQGRWSSVSSPEIIILGLGIVLGIIYCCRISCRRRSTRTIQGNPLASDSFDFDSRAYFDKPDESSLGDDDDEEEDDEDDIELPTLGKDS